MFAEVGLHGGTLQKVLSRSEMLALRIVLLRSLSSKEAPGNHSGCPTEPYHRVQVDSLETSVVCLPLTVCKDLRASSEMAQ